MWKIWKSNMATYKSRMASPVVDAWFQHTEEIAQFYFFVLKDGPTLMVVDTNMAPIGFCFLDTSDAADEQDDVFPVVCLVLSNNV